MLRLLLVLAVIACPAVALAETQKGPNILFVFTDDHASHAISAYGSRINKTPHIDSLAKEGMLFRNCFCTNSICAPSRAVILTGKHSHLNGVIDNAVTFDGKQQHLGKLLGAAGYQTAMIGKWHLKSDPTGFDHWAVLSGAGGQGTYYNPEFNSPKGKFKTTGYATDIITDMAMEWLRKRDRNRPFLLMYQHKAPHREWEPGPDHLDLYKGVKIPEPATLFDDHAGLASPAKKQEMTIERHLTPRDLKLITPANLTAEQRKKWETAYGPENQAFEKAKLTGKELVQWKYQRYIKDYLRCVASVDDNLGRVLKYLDDSGLAKNTIVVYSSDQGFYLGDRGWYDKRWMYDESLRMPFIVRWPGVVKPGSESKDLVQNLDFAPTFLDAAGVKVPADMQGESVVPILKGKTPDSWRKSIYYQYFEYPAVHMVHRHYGVRTATHKLIHYYQASEWELFDLKKDPGERKSVYSDPEYTDVVAELKTELTRLRKLYKADTFKEPPAQQGKGKGKKARSGLQVRYTFSEVNKDQVLDASGNGISGTLIKAKVVKEKDTFAAQFSDEAYLQVRARPELDVSRSPIVLGSWINADLSKGVIAAIGGETHGLSLFLKDGVPTFAVRSQGKLTLSKAEDRLATGRWVHVMGVLAADGRIRVYIDGKASGDMAQAELLTARPADGLSIGADTGSLVGDYPDAQHFTGMLRDVRLYRGIPTEEELKKWREK